VLLGHQTNVEGHLARLLEETVRSRATLADDLRALGGRLGDRSAAEADRDRLLEGQRAVEAQVGSHVARLAEEAQHERELLIDELRNLAVRVTDRSADVDHEALGAHQRNLESRLASLGDDSARRHSQLSEQLRQAVDRLADGSKVEADREALAGLQRNVEAQLNRLLQDSVRGRASLAEDLRSAIARLAERFADVDRDAMAGHQRNIEAHLARLVEDTAQSRTALADELRGEIRLLARTIALRSGGAVAGQPQPSADG
jgi:gas vesicle protein